MDGMQSDDDLDVSFPDPIGGPVPQELETGDPEDNQLLRQIAARASLDRPRAWRHYLYAADEDTAQALARPLARTGWEAGIWAPEAPGEPYCVIAEQTVVLTADLVRSSREMFQHVTSLIPGTEYDGWEASLSEDEYLEPGRRQP
jgi:Regulator of ribonuclease activity B